ncbi:MAG: transposase [Planctomycetaceae bacterium]
MCARRQRQSSRRRLGSEVKQLMKHIEKFIEGHAVQPLVKAMMSFRGIQILSATVIAAEIGDLRRFKTAGQFMAFFSG